MGPQAPRPGAEALRPAAHAAAWLERMAAAAVQARTIEAGIREADTVAALQALARAVDALLSLLQAEGVRAHVLGALVQRLNAQLFARLWSLLAAPGLVADSCLLVMGSEGRGEQTVKTDQDNALLLRGEHPAADLEAVAARFSRALADFGYPPCPGGIMLVNPLWRQPLGAFRQTLREWVFGADPEGPMRLAIFLDATAVAGDPGLLSQARQHIDEVLADNDAFLARFAAAADQFRDAGSWWRRLLHAGEAGGVDLKKLGTFPLVHGVRSLALKHRIREVGTVDRLRCLVDAGHLGADQAGDLAEALHVLMDLKLANNLRQARLGVAADNRVPLDGLGTLQRQQLRATLALVRRFRRELRRRFTLDAL